MAKDREALQNPHAVRTSKKRQNDPGQRRSRHYLVAGTMRQKPEIIRALHREQPVKNGWTTQQTKEFAESDSQLLNFEPDAAPVLNFDLEDYT